ncbi:acyltransferase family protein [Hymenobacter sp. AT01-02]|uniref:acyltransferase family protein n=1 Tax=Hymenobacter sp. AT01-02 TaxID=1571877 RepID=UPI00092FBEC9|nr:heparan-alpha-glucosaminide N-acetyltransferase domain-containing protein [Hymenobacter sp. AT01-02]
MSTLSSAAPLGGATPVLPACRLVSLDVFRGLTVLLMLLVNNPGDYHFYYTPLVHAPWHGCRPADLIFPSFVFIMGVALVYGLGSVQPVRALHRTTLWRVGRRAGVLLLLGLLIGLIPYFYFTSFRIPGVLQRIALVYAACCVVFLKTNWRQQAGLLAFILVLYNVLLQVVPVPGYGPANLAPATNLGAWLDRLLFHQGHLFVEQEGWDPEGLLGTLPTIATGLLGVLTGQWLRQPAVEPTTKVVWLFVAGSGLVVAGCIWNGWFPINKPLWTSSYVLYAGGIDVLLVAALYFLCDVQGWRGAWTLPLRVCGSNALLVFFLPEALERVLTKLKLHHADGTTFYLRNWLYQNLFAPYFRSPYYASLAYAIAYTALWVALLWVLYRRRLFFTA